LGKEKIHGKMSPPTTVVVLPNVHWHMPHAVVSILRFELLPDLPQPFFARFFFKARWTLDFDKSGWCFLHKKLVSKFGIFSFSLIFQQHSPKEGGTKNWKSFYPKIWLNIPKIFETT